MSKDSSKKERENIFEILDGIMFQLSRTKKMFLIMILTTLIIPPVALLTITSVFDSPFEDRFKKDLDANLKSKLDSGEITEEEHNMIKEKLSKREKLNPFLHPHQPIILAISLIWLVIGVRQWFVLSKWDKKYKQFKENQKEIDKKFEDDSDDEDNSNALDEK